MVVALGEAFINVRADLKPFAKDVEKGVKEILRAVEKRLTADGQFGRTIGENIRKQTSDGVSSGLEEGFDRGARRGSKKALSTSQKFFAALADFADDGLSAIPGKVKAGILIGVLAAAAVIAPLLGGFISAAITSGIGIGVIGLGVALASQFRVVQDQFTAVGRSILDSLRESATVFINPLQAAGGFIIDEFNKVGDVIDRIFGQAALSLRPLTTAITGLVTEMLPGISVAVQKARPLIEALAVALPKLGRDFAAAFAILADGSPQAVVALRDLLNVIGTLIIVTATFIRGLSDLYFWMRVIGEAKNGDMASAMTLIAEREEAARLASGQLTDGLSPLNDALGDTAAEAMAARLAIADLVTQQLRGVDATLDYEAAIDDLRASIKEGNKDFRETEANGRTNLRLVEQAITGAARIRDAEISKAVETGRSTDAIEADYRRQIDAIEKAIGKNKAQGESLKEMFRIAREGPDRVDVEVTTPGLPAATTRMNNFAGAIRRAISAIIAAGVAASQAPNFGSGINSIIGGGAKKYANGGIVNTPTMGLIGEAGYKEAIIPDPAVMPGRAMELSNSFGLTSMIADALGAGKTIVNVFIGQQRLEEIADYRIQQNNTFQAQSLAYGPRPA